MISEISVEVDAREQLMAVQMDAAVNNDLGDKGPDEELFADHDDPGPKTERVPSHSPKQVLIVITIPKIGTTSIISWLE